MGQDCDPSQTIQGTYAAPYSVVPMLPFDTLTCELVPNAIKNDSLSCSMPPLEHLQLWATIGNLATAAVTVVLAFFAYRAWRVSRKTLERMEADSEAHQVAIQLQIEEQQVLADRRFQQDRQLAMEQRSSDALIEHLKAIRRMQVLTRNPKTSLLEASSDCSITWAAWAMYQRNEYPMLVGVTSDLNDAFVALSGYLQRCLEMFQQGTLDQAKFERIGEAYGNTVGNYIGNMTEWQTVIQRRLEKEDNLRHLMKELQDNFPGVVT